MIVVADTTPLHYLVLIDEVDLLRRLYSEVVIPREVADELTRPGAPTAVSRWLSSAADWLRVTDVNPEEVASVSDLLDPGERAAIALALTLKADLLLIDDASGREEAKRRNIRFTGTIGVLRTAAEKDFIDVPAVLARLQGTTFYVDEVLLQNVFARWL